MSDPDSFDTVREALLQHTEATSRRRRTRLAALASIKQERDELIATDNRIIRELKGDLEAAEQRVAELEAALREIAENARSAYGVAEQGGAKEIARAALATSEQARTPAEDKP